MLAVLVHDTSDVPQFQPFFSVFSSFLCRAGPQRFPAGITHVRWAPNGRRSWTGHALQVPRGEHAKITSTEGVVRYELRALLLRLPRVQA